MVVLEIFYWKSWTGIMVAAAVTVAARATHVIVVDELLQRWMKPLNNKALWNGIKLCDNIQQQKK